MAKNTLTFSAVTRTVTDGYNREHSITEYVAEYSDDSGILHVKQSKAGHTKIYGNAGEGYCPLDETDEPEFMRALNMAGLSSVKVVSSEAVDFGIVNEF